MKINRNNTALHFLTSPVGKLKYAMKVPKKWDAGQIEAVRYMIEVGFQQKKELYKKRIRFMSDPFLEAYFRAKDRITLNLATDQDSMQESGTMIVRRDDGGRNTMFYTVSISKDAEGTTELKGSLIVFGTCHDKTTDLPVLQCAYIKTPGGDPYQYLSEGGLIGFEPGTKREEAPFAVWIDLVFLLIFMKYCEVETKIVVPGRKVEHAGNKYINDTEQPIEIVDSTWFTTIIRSEGFGVKGHFRLQPFPAAAISEPEHEEMDLHQAL